MESKLKALKVVDLKAILSKATVSFTARATKADLIAKILASPSAIDAFNNANGAPSTPEPVVQVPKPTPSSVSQPPPDPEVRIGSARVLPSRLTLPRSLQPQEANPDPPAAVSEAPAHRPPQPQSPPSKASESAPQQSPAQDPPPSGAPNAESIDPELEKRKARAARFGIPLVEQKAPKPKQTKPSKAPPVPKTAPPEETAKLKARAERFGVTAPQSTPQPNGSTKSRKRVAPPPDPVDEAEAEKRRKRAERFGLTNVK